MALQGEHLYLRVRLPPRQGGGQQPAGLSRRNSGTGHRRPRRRPGVTWIRDTRDSPLDAHRGTYTSFQEFSPSDKSLGAEAQFNRLDLTNSSYYGFDKGRFVFARNTRYGQMRAFGTGSAELIPLPERLYSGGPTSLRGFSFNGAGPRDPETGFPSAAPARSSTARNCACLPPRCPGSATPSASSSSTTWATSSPTPATPGPAFSASTSPIANACKVLSPAR
jgi:outer membrane protein assembly factor BamA